MLFHKKSVGLVLGGGGARGFFHIGVIKAIKEKGIKIDSIAGTSIGAIVGIIYAANPEIDFEKLVDELDYFQITKGVEGALRNYIMTKNFNELKIPCCFNATDINKKEEVVFCKGEIFPGLLATIAIPGIFPPVKIEEQYLVDGGVINNLPVSLIKNTDKLIVSDITGPIKKINQKSLPMEVLYSSVAMMQYQIGREELAKTVKQEITYLNLEDEEIFILDIRKKNFKGLIELGYQAMMKSNFS